MSLVYSKVYIASYLLLKISLVQVIGHADNSACKPLRSRRGLRKSSLLPNDGRASRTVQEISTTSVIFIHGGSERIQASTAQSLQAREMEWPRRESANFWIDG